jgi:hypothetical protein
MSLLSPSFHMSGLDASDSSPEKAPKVPSPLKGLPLPQGQPLPGGMEDQLLSMGSAPMEEPPSAPGGALAEPSGARDGDGGLFAAGSVPEPFTAHLFGRFQGGRPGGGLPRPSSHTSLTHGSGGGPGHRRSSSLGEEIIDIKRRNNPTAGPPTKLDLAAAAATAASGQREALLQQRRHLRASGEEEAVAPPALAAAPDMLNAEDAGDGVAFIDAQPHALERLTSLMHQRSSAATLTEAEAEAETTRGLLKHMSIDEAAALELQAAARTPLGPCLETIISDEHEGTAKDLSPIEGATSGTPVTAKHRAGGGSS